MDRFNYHDYFELNEETGRLTWKERTADMFPDGVSHRAWNRKYAGTLALNGINKSSGYRMGDLHGKKTKAHRVVFAMVYGYLPEKIEHIDTDRTNNRPKNLRDATDDE